MANLTALNSSLLFYHNSTNLSDLFYHDNLTIHGNVPSLLAKSPPSRPACAAGSPIPTVAVPYPPYTRQQIFDGFWPVLICYPFLLALCSLGNSLTLFVLAHTKNKGTTNVYMMTVAFANLWILWLYFPVYLFNTKLKYDAGYLWPFFNYYGLQIWGNDTFMHLSDWTLIVFSLERLLSVTFPLTFRQYQSPKYARAIVIILLILAGMATFFDVFDYYYEGRIGNINLYKQYTKPTTPLIPPETSAAFDKWQEVQHSSEIAISLGKFFALLFLNVLIIYCIRRIQSVGESKEADKKRASQQQRNSTMLLLGSVALYIITQFPTVVYNILLVADINACEVRGTIFRSGHRMMMGPSIRVIQMVNYSANFLIYLTVSVQFRSQTAEVMNKYRCCRFIKRHTTDRIKAIPASIKRKIPSTTGPSSKPPKREMPKKLGPNDRQGSVASLSSEFSNVDAESRRPSVADLHVSKGINMREFSRSKLETIKSVSPDDLENETNIDEGVNHSMFQVGNPTTTAGQLHVERADLSPYSTNHTAEDLENMHTTLVMNGSNTVMQIGPLENQVKTTEQHHGERTGNSTPDLLQHTEKARATDTESSASSGSPGTTVRIRNIIGLDSDPNRKRATETPQSGGRRLSDGNVLDKRNFHLPLNRNASEDTGKDQWYKNSIVRMKAGETLHTFQPVNAALPGESITQL